MVNKYNLIVIFIFFGNFLSYTYCQINTPSNPTKPFGSNISYEFGILPTNVSAGDCEVITEYNNWKSNYVENCGSTMARVKFDEQWATVSEGIAYGMLLAAYAADKDLFNRLWAYYKNFRNQNGVMNWKINGCTSAIGFNGATDAELDASMALIVANHQWPNTTTPHNYITDAKALINAIKDHEVAPDGTFYNGDMWKPDCRNPSYQAPAYARAFKKFMADNGSNQNAFWDNVAVKTEVLFAANAHATSGLNTNWSTPAGPPSSSCFGSGTNPDKFGYDACRAPWRQAVDILWYGSQITGSVQNVVNRAIDFWITKGAANVQGGNNMNHDGTGSGDRNCAFWGPVGAQSLAATLNPQRQTFCNEMYTQNLNNSGAGGYFTKILQVIGLFVQSGNFWNPYATTSGTIQTTTVATACNSYNWSQNGQTYTSSGTYMATAGCTNYTLNLTINDCTNLNCSLVDASDQQVITGSPLTGTHAAFLTLVKIENNIPQLKETKSHTMGNVVFNNVPEGTYRIILHKEPNPSQVPSAEVISGFTNFKFEGMVNTVGDNNANGIIEIQLPMGTLAPNAKALAGTVNLGFALQNLTPLPLQIIEFIAKNTIKGNEIHWKTSLEKNIIRITLEKSKDGSQFKEIESFEANNNPNETSKYSFLDTENNVDSYYRLKILEQGEAKQYSKVVFVAKAPEHITVSSPYPNPRNGSDQFVQVMCSKVESKILIKAFDMAGRLINSKLQVLSNGLNIIELDKSSNMSGQIFYYFETENGAISYRTIKY